jgi:hypothetical protein
MRFFLLMLYLTSGFTARSIMAALQLRKGTVPRIVATSLRPVARAFESLFPRSVGEVVWREIFINRPSRHQEHYYSRKYLSHSVKLQALVSPEGPCVHLSRAYRGATHHRAVFGRPEVATFLSYEDDRRRVPHKPIMGDLRYIGIPWTCPGGLLPHKHQRGKDLTRQQKTENEVLSCNRILVESFLARWKCLFGVPVTVAITNSDIQRHPLRRREEPAEKVSFPSGTLRFAEESSSGGSALRGSRSTPPSPIADYLFN